MYISFPFFFRELGFFSSWPGLTRPSTRSRKTIPRAKVAPAEMRGCPGQARARRAFLHNRLKKKEKTRYVHSLAPSRGRRRWGSPHGAGAFDRCRLERADDRRGIVAPVGDAERNGRRHARE